MKIRNIFFVAFILLFLVLLISYNYFDNESLELNDEVRHSLGGDFLKTPMGSIHYELKGPDTSRCVILIHGYSSPMSTWLHQFAFLTDSGFTVLRYDLFGRGFSDRPDLKYDLALFSDQLNNLLSVLKIKTPVDLIGLSLGGHIAADFALKNKSKVSKIILLNPQITPLRNTFLELPLIGEFLMGTRVIPNLKYYQEQKSYKGFGRALLSTAREMAGIDPFVKYREIAKTHPVAIIWGKQDKNSKLLYTDKYKEFMKDIDLYLIEDAGHAAHFTKPKEVNVVIMDFLVKVD